MVIMTTKNWKPHNMTKHEIDVKMSSQSMILIILCANTLEGPIILGGKGVTAEVN